MVGTGAGKNAGRPGGIAKTYRGTKSVSVASGGARRPGFSADRDAGGADAHLVGVCVGLRQRLSGAKAHLFRGRFLIHFGDNDTDSFSQVILVTQLLNHVDDNSYPYHL